LLNPLGVDFSNACRSSRPRDCLVAPGRLGTEGGVKPAPPHPLGASGARPSPLRLATAAR
jgi:hypothetical protein